MLGYLFVYLIRSEKKSFLVIFSEKNEERQKLTSQHKQNINKTDKKKRRFTSDQLIYTPPLARISMFT